MTPAASQYDSFTLAWRDFRIDVRYAADWCRLTDTAHLVLTTVHPPSAPLPVTETGYRSHFLARRELEAVGGALAFVEQWLDAAAKDKTWLRQLSLF